MKKILSLSLILFLFLSQFIFAEEKHEQIIDEYLVLGPISAQFPAYNDKGKNTFSYTELLKFDDVNTSEWWPSEGDTFEWKKGKTLTWKKQTADDGTLELPEGDDIKYYYVAFYVETDRWVKAGVEVKS